MSAGICSKPPFRDKVVEDEYMNEWMNLLRNKEVM